MYSIIHSNVKGVRRINPADIAVPPGFKADVFAEGLTTPINITMTDEGDMLAGDAGAASYTGGGGSERLIGVLYSGGDEMFAADFGLTLEEDGGSVPGTGVIWRITRALCIYRYDRIRFI